MPRIISVTTPKAPVNTPPSVDDEKKNQEPIESADQVNVSIPFKPIRKSSIVPSDPSSTKRSIVLDEDGINVLVNAIIAGLSERFVAKSEVESIITKTLQKMLINKTDVAPKRTPQIIHMKESSKK